MKINIPLQFYQLHCRPKCAGHMRIDLCQIIAKINSFIAFKNQYIYRNTCLHQVTPVFYWVFLWGSRECVVQSEDAKPLVSPALNPGVFEHPRCSSCCILMLSFECRGLCKIFLLPKKRGEAEPLGFQLGPSVPAGWHHPRNCYSSFCILAVFKVWSLVPSQKLSSWDAWRWWNPSSCFVCLISRAWRWSGLLSPGFSPATVTPAMWFTLA